MRIAHEEQERTPIDLYTIHDKNTSVRWEWFLILDAPPIRDLVVQPNGVGCDSILCVFPMTVMDYTVECFTYTHRHVILHLYLTCEKDRGMIELALACLYPFLKAVLLRLSLLCWYSLVNGDPAGSAFSIPPTGMDYVSFIIDEGFEELCPRFHSDLLLNLHHEIDNCYFWHSTTDGVFHLKCVVRER